MLVDTSVWIEHFRRGDASREARLHRDEVECHPFVIGEVACGHMRNRTEILALMRRLPSSAVADHEEVLQFIEMHQLMGTGIGWVDAHLLASVSLARTSLWTRDRRLAAVARRLGVCVGK